MKLQTINNCSFGDLNYTALTLIALSEEESEEEAPPPKKTPAKATPAKKAPAKTEESDDDDDDDGMSISPYVVLNFYWIHNESVRTINEAWTLASVVYGLNDLRDY